MQSTSKESVAGPRNFILLACDALRPDFLSCYGYPHATTPAIDSLSENGVLFTNAMSVSCVTPVTFATLFTGTYPFQHGVREFTFTVDKRQPTMAESFAEAGYDTASIVGSVVLDRTRGFDRGFRFHDDRFTTQFLHEDRNIIPDPLNSVNFRFAEVSTEIAMKWLSTRTDKPFFLFMHFWDTHVPFFPPRRFLRPEFHSYSGPVDGTVRTLEEINAGEIAVSATDMNYIRGLYEASVRNVDDSIGRLVKFLADRNVLERTVILLLGDHGCNLGEHGFIGNGRMLYDPDIRIPLIVSGPAWPSEAKHRRIDSLVSTVDIFPTVARSFDRPAARYVRGIDMAPLVDGSARDTRPYVYSEAFFPTQFENKRVALRSSRWKLVREPLHPVGRRSLPDTLADVRKFIYRYLTNPRERNWLRRQLWDLLVTRRHANLYSRVERRVMARRNAVRELFSLKEDPMEQNNVYAARPEIARELDDALRKFVSAEGTDVFNAGKLDEAAVRERLKSLGYV